MCVVFLRTVMVCLRSYVQAHDVSMRPWARQLTLNLTLTVLPAVYECDRKSAMYDSAV